MLADSMQSVALPLQAAAAAGNDAEQTEVARLDISASSTYISTHSLQG